MVSAGRPAVFDADALNLAARPEEFAGRSAPTILTPHPGEAGRLLGMDAIAVNGDRIAAAKTLAARSGCVVVLKGFRSVVASPEGRVALVLAGNAGMATGGAGDVLTGIAGSLLARGFSAFDAASAAAWLHGAAGDLAREGCGEESLVAGDLAAWLPEAFALVREARPA
jgi:NAD(P)H-hydrate epimerase